jgi:ADP-ribose pyrophosphatase YjhB (NUDIX family)
VIAKFFYRMLSKLVALSFSILNLLLGGNLPPFGSVSIIVEDQGKLLVVRRHKGKFVFPGGFIRWSELPERAAQRECLEETGIEVKILNVLGYSANPSDGFGKLGTFSIIYLAQATGGQLRSSIEGLACWLNEAELPGLLNPHQLGVYECFRSYKEKRTSQ